MDWLASSQIPDLTTIVYSIIAGLTIVGTMIGITAYYAVRSFRRISSAADSTEQKVHEGYKQLYEIERLSNNQLRDQIIDLKGKVTELSNEVKELRHENQDLRDLNMKWQKEVRDKEHRIRNLEQAEDLRKEGTA